MEKKERKKKKQSKRLNFNFLRWGNIRIQFKYLLTFLVTIVLLCVATIIVYFQLNIAKNDVNFIIDQSELSNDLAQIALLIERKDSYVTNYVLFKESNTMENYEETSKKLNQLLEKVEPYFQHGQTKTEFLRIKENSEEIDEIFEEKIYGIDIDQQAQIAPKIKIDTKKTSSVTLINRLIDRTTKEQDNAVVRTNESVNKSTIYLTIANVFAVILGSLLMFFVSRIISKHLHKVVETTKQIAAGDLSVQKIKYNGRDEIGQLAEAVNSLKDNTANVLTEVTYASRTVTNRSEQLTQAANEVREGSEQIAVTMDELASAAETQASSASNLSENMREFVQTILMSQNEGQTIASDSENVLTLTSDGVQLMEQSVKQMERIDTIVSDAVQKVRGLDEQSEQISELISVVKDIAEQTNLLSLNAAIEAARAGEHGQGFAVVADEVRELADGVTESVGEITNIVNNIQSETSSVVDSLNKGYKEVEEGIVQIEKTGESFTSIDQSITKMAKQIENIANRLNEVATNSEEMNHLIEDIAAVSEESAAGVEQSAASTQETTSAMDEVARNANELEQLAQLLNKEIARFKLS